MLSVWYCGDLLSKRVLGLVSAIVILTGIIPNAFPIPVHTYTYTLAGFVSIERYVDHDTRGRPRRYRATTA